MRSVRICLVALALVSLAACGGEKRPKSAVVPAVPDAQNLPGSSDVKSQVKSVTVGAVLPLTGAYASYGDRVREGLKAGIEEIGASPLHVRIDLQIRDGAGDAEKTNAAYKELVDAGAIVFVGAVAPESTAALAEATAGDGIALVSPVCTAAGLETRSAGLVRLAFAETMEARILARYAYEELNLQLVAMYEDATPEGRALAGLFVKAFEKLGGKVLWRESYIPGTGDYRQRLRAAKTCNPQALFITGVAPELLEICRQAREVGLTQPILGGRTWDQPHPSADIDNVHYASQWAPGAGGPKAEPLSKLLAAESSSPDSYNALGFDAMLLIGHAIETAESPDAIAVAKALAAAVDVPAATGTLASSAGAAKPMFIVSITSGKKALAKDYSTRVP